MRFGPLGRALALSLLISCAGAPSAGAATSFDFLFNLSHVSSDNQYFLNLAVGNSSVPRPVLEPVLPRLPMVEQDLLVVLYLAAESGRPVDFVVSLRARPMPWSVVFGRCGVPLERLYVLMDRDPGPPYGHAWGYWKKHRHARRLSDPEIVGLVNLHWGHRITGIPVCELAYASGGNVGVTTVVADRKGRPWKGPKDDRMREGDDDQGHDHGNGNGHGHDEGNGHGQEKGY